MLPFPFVNTGLLNDLNYTKSWLLLCLLVRCAYDQQGLLLNSLAKTDGILGLSKAKVSLPSQLASQRIINNVLGHCLTSDATGGGYMFLGDDFVPYWGMAWVPMLNSHSPWVWIHWDFIAFFFSFWVTSGFSWVFLIIEKNSFMAGILSFKAIACSDQHFLP